MDLKINGGDEFNFNRILARETSIGQSSRVYYRSPVEGVPFKWEKLPGTPKNQPEEEVIPPLSPPPQVQSKGLPSRPSFVDKLAKESNDDGRKVKFFWLWKKIKGNDLYRKVERLSRGKLGDGNFGLRRLNHHESCSSSSSTSTSTSSTWNSWINNNEVLESSSMRKEMVDGPFCCNPWNITPIMVHFVLRGFLCSILSFSFSLFMQVNTKLST